MSRPGRLVLMGSGETAPTMVGTHRAALRAAGASSITILDTPFGFQENVGPLTRKLAEFFRTSLMADVAVASLRRPDAAPADVERMLHVVRTSKAVFAGPGSPSYAMSVWRSIGLGEALVEVISGGGSVLFASAAALTAGVSTIPVYEIYKVGHDPYWMDGLDLTSPFGLPMVVVPHWNNAEGGDHDTSRCYIGERRLGMLQADLDVGILGIDEHTAATIDFARGVLTVSGKGTVTLRGNEERVIDAGSRVGLDTMRDALGGSPPLDPRPQPDDPSGIRDLQAALAARDADAALTLLLDTEERAARREQARPGLRSMIVALSDAAREGLADPREVLGGFVSLLVELRETARSEGRYAEADAIRDRLAELGVEVRDTTHGSEWHLGGTVPEP